MKIELTTKQIGDILNVMSLPNIDLIGEIKKEEATEIVEAIFSQIKELQQPQKK